jgi:hypothetical protein
MRDRSRSSPVYRSRTRPVRSRAASDAAHMRHRAKGFVTAYSPHPLIAPGLAHSKVRRQLEVGVGLAGRLIAKLPPRMNSPGSIVRVARHKPRGKPF